MPDMDHGFKLAQDMQQLLIECEAWAANCDDPKVASNVQAAHDSLSRAFVAAKFSEAQTAAIFPGARGGAQPQDGGGGGGKSPPPQNPG